MEDGAHQTQRMIIEAGDLLILHPDGPAGGYPMVVAVDQVADGPHWFLGCCDPVTRGETLTAQELAEKRGASRRQVARASRR